MPDQANTPQHRADSAHEITEALNQLFATEDEVLRQTTQAAREAGLPAIQIAPAQGKLLQVLAAACGARKILEIGALAGYSAIWMARALPADGKFITLEIDPKHAEVVRQSLERAQLTDRAEVRVGSAQELLPQLKTEAPFDLIFIDADKAGYPGYLDWALTLSRPGSIIVADDCIRNGKALNREQARHDAGVAGIHEYNSRVAAHPRLVSTILAVELEDFIDGCAVSVVLPE
ncbi:O-methyltransferase [Ktedonosporobacter rubrisoli]|uniref:O-methyltransferase n=1 Tax=Ktedonosporobacter rubrisoli TaxID=2509675 RepID=A0A4P6JKZ6_KTERU|nr:O-methyltransferase [Ktedonosporobacter rubrisoli]QBD75844.1 O-methyltransferase [Ktedonosporobacter rubrisoli]